MEKLRAITLAVQIIPFAYTGLYIIVLSLYLFASEGALSALDSLFYVSPMVVLAFLIESRMLRLCRWHRLACSLPLLPQIEVAVDRWVYEFTVGEAYILIGTVMVMAVLLLIAAYKVFLAPRKDGRKKGTHRDT